MTVTIEFIDGPDTPSRNHIQLSPGGQVSVGREVGCDIVVADRLLSGKHFLIAGTATDVEMKDLGSRNGTKLNGQQVLGGKLKDGDEIQAGDSTFRIAIGSSVSNFPPVDTAISPAPDNANIADEDVDGQPLQVLAVVLSFTDSNGRPDEIHVRSGQRVIVGSSGSADFTFRHLGLQTNHFELRCSSSRCDISSLKSAAELEVNQTSVRKSRLFDRDQVVAGQLQFEVALKGSGQLARPATDTILSTSAEKTARPPEAKQDPIVQTSGPPLISHEPCDNGWQVYRGDAQTISIHMLADSIAKQCSGIALVDHHRSGVELVGDNAEMPVLFNFLDAAAADSFSPRMFPIQTDDRRWHELTLDAVGFDGLIFCFSDASTAELSERLQTASHARGGGIQGFCWPSVLAAMTTSMKRQDLTQLLPPNTCFLCEQNDDPEGWQLLASEEMSEVFRLLKLTVKTSKTETAIEADKLKTHQN